MRWIILSSASGAITAYIVTKVICIKFLGELEKIITTLKKGGLL